MTATYAGVVLGVHDVHKAYPRGSETVHALRGVTVRLHPGEMVALVGRSGSGKTTLLNVLAGWERPDRGQVVYDAAASAELPDTARRWDRLAIVPQTLGLLDELSIGENITLPLAAHGALTATQRSLVDALVDTLVLVGLVESDATEVSLGERQRAAVARALVTEPAVVLADEPTSHQDADHVDRVLDALRAAAGRGTACLVATHNPELLAAMDRVVELHDGRARDDGSSSTSP